MLNVHIVCRDFAQDRILPRLARTLANYTGWSIGQTPNGRADLNYFIIYIDYAENFSAFRDTPVAAWFTHYEEGTDIKRRWWDIAAQGVDLRLTSARMYLPRLQEFGPSALVTPPVAQDQFVPREKPSNKKPVVGVSGFVPRGGRKGEWMVGKLAYSKLAQKFNLVASGQGWPVRKQSTRALDKLPSFYQGLDVLLCTSLVEGVPMPPLEALACGVPVVIPQEVGLLDDLPDIHGIYRFEAGSYPAMEDALSQALADSGVNRNALREAVAPYTPKAWAESHQRAFENLLYDIPATQTDSGERGVYYVAYGKPARRCATTAIDSFRQYMPDDIKIALASTEPLGNEDVFIQHDDADIGGRAVKTKIYDLAPQDWQYIMYLDADTEIVADVTFLFNLLRDGWDMVICKNPSRFHIAEFMVREDNINECNKTFEAMGTKEVIQLNGGVFAFQRNERTRAFFQSWHAEWRRWGKRDQAALLRAMWQYPVKLCVLTNVWNTITRYMSPEESAGILHYPMTARRWDGIVHGRSDSKEAWGKVKEWTSGKA